MIRPIIHMLLHFLVPGAVAAFGFRERWQRAWLVMSATIVVDVDHLLASPLYDPNRCSIGFHPLHSYYILPLYVLMCFFPKTRLVGLGLVIHMALDFIDCLWMKGVF